jgi:sortase A
LKKSDPIRRWIERLLLIVGVACLGTYGFAFVDARLFEAEQNRRLDQELQERAAQRKHAPPARPEETPEKKSGKAKAAGDEAAADASPASETDSFASFGKGTRDPDADLLHYEEGELLGRVRIPRTGVSAILLEGISHRTLRHGVGHIPGTSLPSETTGNVGIAGHRDSFFRGLKDIDKDDVIEVTTLDGTWRYKVEWTRVVRPTDTKVLTGTEGPSLTLVTCYPFYYVGSAPKRFIVRAHLIDAPEEIGASPGG